MKKILKILIALMAIAIVAWNLYVFIMQAMGTREDNQTWYELMGTQGFIPSLFALAYVYFE